MMFIVVLMTKVSLPYKVTIGKETTNGQRVSELDT